MKMTWRDGQIDLFAALTEQKEFPQILSVIINIQNLFFLMILNTVGLNNLNVWN